MKLINGDSLLKRLNYFKYCASCLPRKDIIDNLINKIESEAVEVEPQEVRDLIDGKELLLIIEERKSITSQEIVTIVKSMMERDY